MHFMLPFRGARGGSQLFIFKAVGGGSAAKKFETFLNNL